MWIDLCTWFAGPWSRYLTPLVWQSPCLCMWTPTRRAPSPMRRFSRLSRRPLTSGVEVRPTLECIRLEDLRQRPLCSYLSSRLGSLSQACQARLVMGGLPPTRHAGPYPASCSYWSRSLMLLSHFQAVLVQHPTSHKV